MNTTTHSGGTRAQESVETVCGCMCDKCRHTPQCCLGIYCDTKEL